MDLFSAKSSLILYGCVLFCCFAWTDKGPAQVLRGKIHFAIGGNLQVPLNPEDRYRLDDNFKSGGGFSADFSVPVSRQLAVQISAEYQTFSPDRKVLEEELGNNFQESGNILKIHGRKNLLMAGLHLSYTVPAQDRTAGFEFFLGGGYYHSLIRKLEVEMELYGHTFLYEIVLQRIRSPGIHGGAGVEFLLWDSVTFFSRAQFHRIFLSSSDFSFLVWKNGLRIALGGGTSANKPFGHQGRPSGSGSAPD
jgi:hypothetical protein